MCSLRIPTVFFSSSLLDGCSWILWSSKFKNISSNTGYMGIKSCILMKVKQCWIPNSEIFKTDRVNPPKTAKNGLKLKSGYLWHFLGQFQLFSNLVLNTVLASSNYNFWYPYTQYLKKYFFLLTMVPPLNF